MNNRPSLGRLITGPHKRRTQSFLSGVVIKTYASTADVKLQDGSVINMPIASDPTLLMPGASVKVQWVNDSTPFVVSGGGTNAGAIGGVTRLNISNGVDAGEGELGYLLPDFHNVGVAMVSAVLNKQLAGVAMPSNDLYVGLMLAYVNENSYTEVTTAYISNYKRARLARSVSNWGLVTNGERISNAVDIGIGSIGSNNSMLSTGTGAALVSTSSLAVIGVGAFDAQTGGNFWFGGRLTTPITLRNNDIPAIKAGKLNVGFSNQILTQFEKRNFLNVALNNMDYVRPTYSIALLTGSGWAEPTPAQWPNYKRPVIYRDTTTFPPTSSKSIKNGIVIGGGTSGSQNSFFSTGDTAYITGGTFSINAVGVIDHQNTACWRVPFPNNETEVITNGIPVSIEIGKLLFKLS